MATTIVLKNSVTTTNTPSSLAQGEVAINVTDKKVWVGNAATTPVQIVNGGPDGVFTSVTDSGLTNTRVTYAGAGGLLKDSASITTDGTTITAAFSGAHNGTVGATTPAAGTFTAITGPHNGTVGATTPTTGAFTTVAASSTVTGTALIPSGSSAPTNGVYLPTTNAVGIATNGSEKMRVTSSGTLFLNITNNDPIGTNSGNGLMAAGPSSSENAINYFNATGPTLKCGRQSDGSIFDIFRNTSTTVVQVGSVSVTTTATAYNTTSDYRLKENVTPIANALESVAKLKPVDYTWKVDSTKGQGFIAHELQEVCPQAVTGTKDAVDESDKPIYQTVDTSFLVGMLTKAIQELNAKVDTQAAEIAALKAGV